MPLGKKTLKLVALHDHGQMGEPFEKHVEMQDENYGHAPLFQPQLVQSAARVEMVLSGSF